MIRTLFDTLFRIYGEQHWWPCKSGSRWEIITGAILTQNTAWTNVEKALANLESADMMSAEKFLTVPDEELQELIRPAGFFTSKSKNLKSLAEFFLNHEQRLLHSQDVWALRKELLAQNGVGRETADSILLYAFSKLADRISVTRAVEARRSRMSVLRPRLRKKEPKSKRIPPPVPRKPLIKPAMPPSSR
jgi:endonuclease-3 related protein